MKAAFCTVLAIAASAVVAQNITCATQQQACDEQTGANHACCGALYASCTAGTTTPDSPYNQCSNGPPCPTCTASVPAATASTVSAACADLLTSCDSQIGANHACCAALQASCLAGTVTPEADFSQCSNGPPCPTCTATGVAVGTGSTTSSSPTSASILTVTSTSTSTSASSSTSAETSASTSALTSASTSASTSTSPSKSTSTSASTSAPALSGDAGERLSAGRIFAAGLAVAFML